MERLRVGHKITRKISKYESEASSGEQEVLESIALPSQSVTCFELIIWSWILTRNITFIESTPLNLAEILVESAAPTSSFNQRNINGSVRKR